MNSFPLYELQIFLKVAEFKNITLAAQEIGLGQSAISQAIKRLETILRTSLLIRKKTGVSLTQTGMVLQREGQKLLLQCDNLTGIIEDNHENIQGKYTLGLHQSVALFTLPLFMRGLIEKCPQLSLQLTHAPSNEIFQKVVDSEIQMGIVIGEFSHQDLVIKKIGHEFSTLWIHKDLKKTEQYELPLIYVPSYNQTVELFKSIKKLKNKFDRTISTSSYEVVKALVLNRVGVGIIPYRTIEQSHAHKTLRPYFSKKMQFQEKISLICRYDFLKNSAGKKLYHHIYNDLVSQLDRVPL